MSKENPATFKEVELTEENRRHIVQVLKEEGFSEEQLNTMSFEKVWNLYKDSISKTISDMFDDMARVIQRNPQLASEINQLIRETNRLLDLIERELEKKKEKKE